MDFVRLDRSTHVVVPRKDDEEGADGGEHGNDPRIRPGILPDPSSAVLAADRIHFVLIGAIEHAQVEIRAGQVQVLVRAGAGAEEGVDDERRKRKEERADAARVGLAVALSADGGVTAGELGGAAEESVEDDGGVRERAGWDGPQRGHRARVGRVRCAQERHVRVVPRARRRAELRRVFLAALARRAQRRGWWW
jgi:hypothetical protein